MTQTSVPADQLEWERGYPAAITSDTIWKLNVYRAALYLLDLTRADVSTGHEARTRSRVGGATASFSGLDQRQHRRRLQPVNARRPASILRILPQLFARMPFMVSRRERLPTARHLRPSPHRCRTNSPAASRADPLDSHAKSPAQRIRAVANSPHTVSALSFQFSAPRRRTRSSSPHPAALVPTRRAAPRTPS